jgi:hypothetical protein
MRALRTVLIIAVVLAGVFVIADRVAVNFAEDEAAEQLRTAEGLARTPDVSIKGFPFLTQMAGGELDDVEVGIEDYEAATGDGGQRIRIDELRANLKGVRYSDDYSSGTADSATGTATIAYDELLKTAKSEPTEVAPGVTAQVVGLSDGGNGKIDVQVQATVFGIELPRPVSVLSTVTVQGDTVRVKADALPELGGVSLAEDRARDITDFDQVIEQLPGGVKLDKVEAAENGVRISVKGSDIRLEG